MAVPRWERLGWVGARSDGGGEPMDDAGLVGAANSGDAEAFGELYLRHRSWAWRVARRILGDDDLAWDAVHDAFRQALALFPGFELRARFTTFLYPVVKNAALMALRRRRRSDGVAAPEELLAPGALALVQPDERTPLVKAIAALPEIHREVVLLRFGDELPLEAVAEALGIPLGTAKSRLHHALKALGADPALKKSLNF